MGGGWRRVEVGLGFDVDISRLNTISWLKSMPVIRKSCLTTSTMSHATLADSSHRYDRDYLRGSTFHPRELVEWTKEAL